MRAKTIRYRFRKLIQRFLVGMVAVLLLFATLPQPASAFLSSVDACFAQPKCASALGSNLNTEAAGALTTSATRTVSVDVLDAAGNVITHSTANVSTIATKTGGLGKVVMGIARTVGVLSDIATIANTLNQVKSLQSEATQKYCEAHPSESVCSKQNTSQDPAQTIEHGFKFVGQGQYQDCTLDGRSWGTTVAGTWFSYLRVFNGNQPHGTNCYWDVIYVDNQKVYAFAPGTWTVEEIGESPWQKMSAQQKEEAFKLIPVSRFVEVAKQSPVTRVLPKTLPEGADKVRLDIGDGYIVGTDSEGKPTLIPIRQPIVIPLSGPDPELEPEPSPSPSPSPSPNPEPSPSPSPSPSPEPSPSPSPEPSPSPSPFPFPLTPEQQESLQEHPNFERYLRDNNPQQDSNNKCISTEVGRIPNQPYKEWYKYSTQVAGTQNDYFVMTPDGIGAVLDGLTPSTRNVWEAKYGYDSFFFGYNPRFTDEARAERLIEWDVQKNTQMIVASRCGYNLTWSFSETSVAELAEDRWTQFPPKPRIIHQRYLGN